jgi:phage-related holin
MQIDNNKKLAENLFSYLFGAATVAAALLLTLALWNWIAPHATLLSSLN